MTHVRVRLLDRCLPYVRAPTPYDRVPQHLLRPRAAAPHLAAAKPLRKIIPCSGIENKERPACSLFSNPETRHPEPETRTRNYEIPNPKPETRNPKPRIQHDFSSWACSASPPSSRALTLPPSLFPIPKTRGPTPETRDPETRNPKLPRSSRALLASPEIPQHRNLEPGTGNRKHLTNNPEPRHTPDTLPPKPEIRKPQHPRS